MRDILKMCRICLSQGSRDIFENSNIANLLAKDELSRIAEKLRFVTMLKVSPAENLPRKICDLCIVQLNVSYNFKRLAQKNDVQIRNYMIENGMNISKDDDSRSIETTTALEIHQIQHNVIRTNRYRPITGPEIRRNSTTSSVSGTSTMMINGQNDTTNNNFVTPRPMVRPIQIKIEPVDDEEAKEASPVTSTSSPSNASEPTSVVTVHSSIAPNEKRLPPMIVINGIVNNESFPEETPAPVKRGRPQRDSNKPETSHNLRTIKKKSETTNNSKKLQKAMKAAVQRVSPRKQKENSVQPRAAKFKIVFKNRGGEAKKPTNSQQKARGRPKKTANNVRESKKKLQKGKGKS